MPLILILLKSKNKINNLKNNRILAKLGAITIKKLFIIPINISIKSQKTSFNLGNLFINDFSKYKSYFYNRSLFQLFNLYYWYFIAWAYILYLLFNINPKNLTQVQLLINLKIGVNFLIFMYIP